MPIAAALFDLDGTLLDSEAYIYGAFSASLASVGAPVAAPAAFREVVGHPLDECYRQLAPGFDTQVLCEAHRQWQTAHLEMVRPMPGSLAVLGTLRRHGTRLAAVTNRSRRSSLTSLDRAGLLSALDEVVSSEDVARQKPDPEPVLLALARLGVVAGQAVMIGDTTVDVLAGRAAGTRTVAVRFGFGRATVASAQPDAIVETLTELPSLLQRW